MPDWYWDKQTIESKTPSFQDGISYLTEYRYRKEGARFITDMGAAMDLGYNTSATGVVFFHRFYMFHSFKKFPRYVTAACCLFLAGKVEETPKKCKDIIKVAKDLLSADKFKTFGIDPKEEVMTLEKILLQTIKFDLKVEHPYTYLVTYAKCLKGDKDKLEKTVQCAWTFINDSLCTTLSIEWEPEIIAIAVMYLAIKLNKFNVRDWSSRHPRHRNWWDLFVQDLGKQTLEDICHQILDLYSPPKEKRNLASPAKTKVSVAPATTTTTTKTIGISTTSRSAGGPVTFTTAMAPSATNSVATIISPLVTPSNIKLEKMSPKIQPLMGTVVEMPKVIFPWATIPPVHESPGSGAPLSLVSKLNLPVPPSYPNIPNLYIKQENITPNSENDIPSPNFPVRMQSSKPFSPEMLFMHHSRNDGIGKVDSPYFKKAEQRQENMFGHRSQDMHRHQYNMQNFSGNENDKNMNRNRDNRGIWNNRDSRRNQMKNFQRNGIGPMRDSRQFFKN